MSKIRVIALGLVQDGDRLFVAEGYDAVKQTHFYRALGGGVEFGETSLAALQREFQEEIQAKLTDITYLGCLENLFTFNGQPGHELIQLYRCQFRDRCFYDRDEILFRDGADDWIKGLWISRDRCLAGELCLVPPACLTYL